MSRKISVKKNICTLHMLGFDSVDQLTAEVHAFE